MNNIVEYGLKPGDRIITPKSWMGMVLHHAIYLGQNIDGQDLIAENEFGKFVRVVPADEFFSDYQGEIRVERFNGNYLKRRFAIERALQELNRPYNLINFNCEHFANIVQYGKAFSKQSDFGVFIAFILLGAFILNNLD